MKIRRFSEDFLPVVAVGDDAHFLVQDTADGKVKYATKRQVVDGLATQTDVLAEAQAREDADTALSGDIAGVQGNLTQAVTTLRGEIEQEGNARLLADRVLDGKIASEVYNRQLLAVHSAEYLASAKKIYLYNALLAKIGEIDASAFVIDGMIESVAVVDGNLVISFNTDAGKQDISIPLTDIFDPDNYYTKEETDNLLGEQGERIDDLDATLNDTVSPTLDRIASPAVRKVEYGDIERYISILISSKKVFFKSNGQLNFDDERVAMESLLGVLFVDEISRQNPFYLSEWLINVVDTDEYMGCIRIVPCVGGMSVWVDTLLSGSSLSWKWTRWDCSWEDWSPFTIQINRVIYLSQTMEIYYPYDPNLAKTEQSGNKLLTKKLFGALYFNDFSQFASLATSDEDISILMYAYQIILFPADDRDTSPTQLHQRIDIKCNIGNSFTRPSKLRIAFIQRDNSSSNDKIVRMQWGQALQPLGSGAQSAPMINLYDVDAFLMLRFADFASGSITIENCVGMTGVQVSNPVTKLFESGVYNAG